MALELGVQAVQEVLFELCDGNVAAGLWVQQFEQRVDNRIRSLPRGALVPLAQHDHARLLRQPRLLQLNGQPVQNALRNNETKTRARIAVA